MLTFKEMSCWHIFMETLGLLLSIKFFEGAGEMVHQLRALVAFLGNSYFISNIHMWLKAPCNSSSNDLMPFNVLHNYQECMQCTNIYLGTHAYT